MPECLSFLRPTSCGTAHVWTPPIGIDVSAKDLTSAGTYEVVMLAFKPNSDNTGQHASSKFDINILKDDFDKIDSQLCKGRRWQQQSSKAYMVSNDSYVQYDPICLSFG